MSLTYCARGRNLLVNAGHRVRGHPVPRLPAITAGEQRPGHARRAVLRRRTDPVPRQNSFIAAELAFSCSLGCSVVLADQAAEDLRALDPGGEIDCSAGSARGFLPQALMRTVAVVVAGVLGQDLAEMALAEDQDVIEAFAAERADEPLGKMSSLVATGPGS
jgi:hypothetical protein